MYVFLQDIPLYSLILFWNFNQTSWKNDFPKTYYYIIIGVISILSTWMSFSLIQHFSRVQLMVKRLLDYIIIQIDDKYIPEDKKEAYLKDYMEQIKKL